jgi:undecaprenyl-diphosphatase
MHNILYAILLGIIQGLTEFLPVSSSGHLELAKHLFNDQSLAKESLMMTVVLHGATALSTMFILRKEVYQVLNGLAQFFKTFKTNDDFYFSLKIIISMLPAVIVGLIWEEQIDALFSGNILLVGTMLIVTGLLLFLADRAKTTNIKVSFLSSFIIGLSQAIAILPGVSRSGATISTSVLLGIDRDKAARFSFLMVVPLIFGKILKDISSGDLTANNDQTILLVVGFMAAFVTGLIACKWMISLVKRSQLKYFSFYCFIIGAVAIIYTIV